MRFASVFRFVGVIAFSAATLTCSKKALLNVSYDPTREFYADYNKLFQAHWKQKSGEAIEIRQSHGGSGKQARAVIDGLEADVVTLALAYDIDEIARRSKAVPSDWEKRLPHRSSPYTSTIVLVVRKGNPKNIKDWSDLVRPGISVITPNPKTSGGARWNYLAARWFAVKKLGDEAEGRGFMGRLFQNVPVLDTGARGAMTTFARNKLGDVLISWENEAYLARKEFPGDGLEIVVPSVSILAEPSVAVADGFAAQHGFSAAALEYLNFLYSPEAQDLAAKHHYRPRDPERLKAAGFAAVDLIDVNRGFGGWEKAQKAFFADGAEFDQIYTKQQRK